MTFSRPALTDRQIGHMQFRTGLFQRRGMNETQAERLADRLADRDFERDDRRMCVECEQNARQGKCRQGKPVLDVLQRCPEFTFEKP